MNGISDPYLQHESLPTRDSESEEGSLKDVILNQEPSLVASRVAYENLSSIDWSYETQKERLRQSSLLALPSLDGIIARLTDAILPWFITISTGLTVGFLSGYLDLLSVWLSDLRLGLCKVNWYLNESNCCNGLDVGETCRTWLPWGEIFNLTSPLGTSLVQITIYLSLAVLFAAIAAILVKIYGPLAFHTGIPEIKAILGGLIIKDYLGGWTLLIKSLGLSLAVASGLSLGKEGPMVHVACCVGSLIANCFTVFRENEGKQREVLSAAAAAGLSVAFGAPLGGVMFSLEEASSFFPGRVLWHSFVCAIVAAVTLQYLDIYGTGRLVLFEVTATQVWRAFEILPWLFLGICGGLFGHFFIQLNITFAQLRNNSFLVHYPIWEVIVVAFVTAILSYIIPFARAPTNELVEVLFGDCREVGSGVFDTLCDRDNTRMTFLHLLVTAIIKTPLTALTFGIQIPAGIFLPTMAIGGCFGRAIGIGMATWQRNFPTFWLFSGCPPDGNCIDPSLYAVIGAASALGGVTRMTLSLVVVVFELTGAVSLVVQIMLTVLVSKFTADYLSRDGIYEAWINLRRYTFLNPKVEFRRDDAIAQDYLTPVEELIILPESGWTRESLKDLIKRETYRGFPIVESMENKVLLGYISRTELASAVNQFGSTSTNGSSNFSFLGLTRGRRTSRSASYQHDTFQDQDSSIILRKWVEETPLTLSPETPIEVVVQMFQRLGLRHLLFSRMGKLSGIMTKSDVWKILKTEGSPSTFSDMQRERRIATMNSLRGEEGGQATPTVIANSQFSSSVPINYASENVFLLDDMSVTSSPGARGSIEIGYVRR